MSTLERLGWHRTFKSIALWSVRDGKGLIKSIPDIQFKVLMALMVYPEI
jgi:hypothetical protein